MSDPIIVNSDASLSNLFRVLREEYQSARYLRVSIKKGMSRSLDQNAISFVWYDQLSRELREFDALQWRCYCKFTLGLPLLHAEDADFRSFWDGAVRKVFSYEQKIEMMKFVPITSLMSKPQLSKYLEAMQEHFMPRGVILEFQKDSQ